MKLTIPAFVIALVAFGQPMAYGEDAAVQEAVEIFFKTPKFSQFKLSPDGSHVSMIGHSESQNRLFTFDTVDKKSRGIKGTPGQSIKYYTWIDADHLIFSVDLWNLYSVGNYHTDESFKRTRLIGRERYDYSLNMTFTDDLLSLQDGLLTIPERALFKDYTRNKRFPDLVYYKGSTNSLFGRQRNNGKTVGWECDSKGVIRVIEYLMKPGKYEFAHRWSEDDEYELLGIPGNSWILGFDGSDRRLFVVAANDEGQYAFRIFDIETDDYVGKPISHKEFSCYPGILRGNEAGSVIGAVYDWEKPRVAYFDPTYQQIHKTLQNVFKDQIVRVLGVTGLNTVLFELTSDTQPLRIIELDPNAEQKFSLALHQAPWIKEEFCQPMEPIKFPSRDGKMIHGYLTRSRINPDKQGPTVMLVHGGPFLRDSWEYNPEVQFLAYLGYHVLQVNYRGSSGFNKGYSVTRLPKICKYAVEDVADGARWAIDEGIADPDRLAIVGGSFGGYTALASAAFEPDLYKVAIGTAGVYNYDRQLREDYRGESNLKEWLTPMLGDIANNPDVYKNLSPVNYADQIKAEVLLIHGGADTRVYASQSKAMSKALKNAGKDHVIDISTWGVHGIYKEKESFKYGTLVGEFLKKHL